jgi:DNA-binding transcriptional LysR family regulator
MTLVQLRHFVTLAETATFVQASRALFLTQPALSRSIRALEDELGGPLFDRLGRQVALTPFGAEVLRHARRLVSDAEALKQVGRGLHDGLTGQLRIGLSSAPGALLSTPLMRHLATHHPGLRLQVSRGSTAVLLAELREQRLDGAIVDLRSMVPAADLQVRQAFELGAGFLVRAEHPLARRGGAVSFPELLAYPVASTPLSDEVGRLLVARYGPQANPQDMVTLRCDETLTLVELARTADVVLLTVTAVAADLVRLDVTPPLDATGRFGLVTLGGREQAPALRIVADRLAGWVTDRA